MHLHTVVVAHLGSFIVADKQFLGCGMTKVDESMSQEYTHFERILDQ